MPETINIQSACAPRHAKLAQTGMTMLELLIAMTVLSIGMLGATGMILAGVQANARNKNDTTAVILDQEILERFATYTNYPTSGFVTIEDCALGAAAQHQASTTGSLAGSGAAITATGDIDWTQPAPALATSAVTGYAMNYQACNGDVFEVRWNIIEVSPNANAISQLSELTVSARQTGSTVRRNGMLFSVPTSLHTFIEN
jgi:prepilin-type N-terminal cleavage/methylation domain-containing protein